MAKVDRRVLRTKKSLEQALIALTLEKDYDAITIQEITDRADIGYRTFFRHYSNKDELLQDVLNTTMMALRELMSPPSEEILADPNFSPTDFTQGVLLFQHVQENRDLYQVLMRSERTLKESILDFAKKEMEANLNHLAIPAVSVALLSNHLVWAMWALVRWWLESDMPYTPDQMGEYSFHLIVKPVRELIMQSEQ
jgi:AcrR family transcriptional regulator